MAETILNIMAKLSHFYPDVVILDVQFLTIILNPEL